ncbi:MAG: hypothetical protein LH478_02865 [Chitinophagaceae bacterium]|nr:hypothetical protein [Chitinophagaceae bacterium]
MEGAVGSGEVNNRNLIWEKANGTAFDVIGQRTTQANMQGYAGNPPPLTYSLLVRSSTGKIGAAKLLKVMSGDKIFTTVQYYYPGYSGPVAGSGLNTLVTSLTLHWQMEL